MLGLATHEVNFSVLREEVLFGRAKGVARDGLMCFECGGSGHKGINCPGKEVKQI